VIEGFNEVFVTVKDGVSRCELGEGIRYAEREWNGCDTRVCNWDKSDSDNTLEKKHTLVR